MRAFDIVGYTFQADVWCFDCMYPESVRLFRAGGGEVESMSVESNLDCAAIYAGLDRASEHTFDSDDFPKVIWTFQVEGPGCCGQCGGAL